MKTNLLFLLLLIAGLSGCSSESDVHETPKKNKLQIDGIDILSHPNTELKVWKSQDKFIISALGASFDYSYQFHLTCSDKGEIIDGSLQYTDQYLYTNYIDFPSNYFDIAISTNDTDKILKINFSGKFFMTDTYYGNQYTEEFKVIEGDLSTNYTDQGDEFNVPYKQIFVNDINQYCLAKINGIPWKARFERTYSIFTSSDPYKIEMHFADSPTPGSYTFNSNSTDNYIKFSKFNPLTLTYDYYTVNGTVAYSYREFHGDTRYSFIGTFSFTAVNPANPLDVIQITDGEFRSYQKF